MKFILFLLPTLPATLAERKKLRPLASNSEYWQTMFAEVVERRDAATLVEVISRHVAPGSIVNTDLWRGYTELSETLDVEHRTVNHSQHFVNPDDGTHTNTIEGTWNGIKMKVASRKRCREGVEEHLLEFIWRRKNSSNLWASFLQAMKSVHVSD